MRLSKKQITKVLIRLRGCVGWSARVLFANPRRQVFSCCGQVSLNPIPPIHDNCRLLSHLLMYFGSQYCKHYGPRSDCSLRSSLNRVHSVCFDYKSILGFIWENAADNIFRTENFGRRRVKRAFPF